MAAKSSAPSPVGQFVVDANEFTKGLRSESDRGAALVGMAYLEDLLDHLVRLHMVDEPGHGCLPPLPFSPVAIRGSTTDSEGCQSERVHHRGHGQFAREESKVES